MKSAAKRLHSVSFIRGFLKLIPIQTPTFSGILTGLDPVLLLINRVRPTCSKGLVYPAAVFVAFTNKEIASKLTILA